jgi:hypothetical protein
MSPSHTVGLEPLYSRWAEMEVAIPHGGLGTRIALMGYSQKPMWLEDDLESCRHPTRWAWNCGFLRALAGDERVAIPHGGLGTKLKLLRRRCLHPTRWAWNCGFLRVAMWLGDESESPSHTVGLERFSLSLRAWAVLKSVAIPHGGLGTVGS